MNRQVAGVSDGFFFWHDEEVHAGRRVRIFEGQELIRIFNDVCWHLATDDSSESVLWSFAHEADSTASQQAQRERFISYCGFVNREQPNLDCFSHWGDELMLSTETSWALISGRRQSYW